MGALAVSPLVAESQPLSPRDVPEHHLAVALDLVPTLGKWGRALLEDGGSPALA